MDKIKLAIKKIVELHSYIDLMEREEIKHELDRIVNILADDKLKELKEQLEILKGEHDEYEERYNNFINKEEWNEIYDHMCEQAMNIYLFRLKGNIEKLEADIKELENDK